MNETSTTPTSKVLVVDDEIGLRNMLQFGLARRGYQVMTASDGDQAIGLAEKNRFDLVVCDIMMPGKDGIQVLGSLKSISPDTEVIMATGYATLETAIEAMKQGAFDYITKPYTLQHLCTVFDKAIEHQHLKARVNHLEEVVRLKNEFVANMSHELRTPLASTMGFVSLLLHGVYGPLSEAQKMALQRAELNSRNLLEQINAILDFSKVAANRMTLAMEAFSLNDVVTEVMHIAEPLAKAKNLTMAVEGPVETPLYGDKTKLKQVLINLVGNSIKFTQAGQVSMKILLPEDSRQIQISVKDTGIGIDEKDFPILFQEFRQIDGSTTRPYMGTGLGLAICKKFVELMGGSIRVSSTVGVGSLFTVELPIRTDKGAAEEPTRMNLPGKPGERIVVAIDDDPDVLKMLSDSLAGTEFRFVGTHNGKEGLALIRKYNPYSVLLDIMMPDMDGWQVLQALKSDPQLRSIPVYVVSMVDQKAQAFSLGVAGYIQKPFDRDQLLHQLAFIPRKAKQILLVDDDPDIRHVFMDALTREGYEVISVASGEEAMARMNQLCPDVLFLDLMLPGMSGFDVLHALGDRLASEQVAVFVMTAKDLTQEEDDYLRRRVQMVLRKGTTPLMKVLETLKAKLAGIQKVA